ncbi:hypothetical protein Cgig2_002651 [Carnegiea gigantea]|uniref:Uncharacterized protein n=1 Tax=Carnegiea gigantea TaxID=171969 RepID=A0A9Q1GS46_9CARY|nr:hypothetical protein Cgig2_002651 [Carnegiea gigantea]
MSFARHSLFITSVHILFEQYASTGAPKHTLKGEVSISLMGIHGFLGLPLSGFLFHEVVSPSKELKTSLGKSSTHLFVAYHILQHRFDHKPIIKEWIAFWFCGPIKYHAPMNKAVEAKSLPTLYWLNSSWDFLSRTEHGKMPSTLGHPHKHFWRSWQTFVTLPSWKKRRSYSMTFSLCLGS